jgi:aspartyl-tRNA(Asn)/glutamyl-tRNA(Gln) amidotransferase subunit C
MPVDKATVERVAHLARIAVREDELEPLAAELNNILAWVEQLNEVDTDAVEPMASVHDETLRQRADEVTDGGKQADILANGPELSDGQFVVPRVIE